MKKRQQRRQRYQKIEERLFEHQLPDEVQSQSEEKPRSEHIPDDEVQQWLIEQRIQQAMAEGAFDNLAGQGKPLDLKKNPYLDPAQRLAFDLLQNNQVAPEWIERDKEIRREWTAARQQLRRAWQAYQANSSRAAVWEAALNHFKIRLRKINRRIDDFNLIVPILSCQRARLRLDDELRWVRTEDEGTADHSAEV